MLNYLWPFFIIISIIYSLVFGNISDVNNEIFNSIKITINICIELLGTIGFWNGIMKIAEKSSIIDYIAKLIKPITKLIFPNIKSDSKAYKDISMNIVSNMMGLGNAATPLGIKAMQELKKENNNKDELSKEMKMFILINTASIQIIPTTVIAIRSANGAKKPTEIIFPIWIASICAFITVVLIMKIILKLGDKK